jgi:ribosomal protein L35
MQSITEDQIEVTLSSGATKSMKEAAINLISSFGEEFTMDQFVEEMAQVDHVTDEEAIERYRNNQAMQYRRMFGAFKSKSNRMIQESKQGNFSFFLPLYDGVVIETGEGTVITAHLAERRHLLAHRQINAERRTAKIAVLNAADALSERARTFVKNEYAFIKNFTAFVV